MFAATDHLPRTLPRTVSDRCSTCAGRRSAVCGAIPEALLTRLAAMGRSRSLKRGDTLVWDGEDAAIVANVREGMLQLTSANADGQEQILGLAFPGDFIGQPHGGVQEQRVVALSDVSVCVFRRADFAALLAEAPELAQALLVRAFDDLARARAWMQLVGRKSAEERVASLLWMFVERMHPMPGTPVPLPLSRQQIADVLGLTIETVSRKMRGFEREGLISLPTLRSFVVEETGAFRALAA